MIVYGDGQRKERSRAKLARVCIGLRRARALPPGIVRHARLVEALIEAGELLQGVADAVGDEALSQGVPPGVASATQLTLALARCCLHSWCYGFALAHEDAVEDAVRDCACQPLPAWITVHRCEGYAFYGLYPEGHGMAALQVRESGALSGERTRVVGLRSIGTSLAAMVAAGLRAPGFETLRPQGHPFDRQAGALPSAGWAPDAALVDEGPGLSGSSFLAGVEALRRAGVPPRRVHLFPSHGHGPGPAASPPARQLWREQPVHYLGFDDVAGAAALPPHRVMDWVRDRLPGVAGDMIDLSGGAWRARHGEGTEALPAQVHMERLKFLLPADGGDWLLRFAGLGRGSRLACARRHLLARHGFCPPVQGLWHGFTAERWLAHARPLPLWPAAQQPTRGLLLERLAEYLAFRGTRLPAPATAGATREVLLDMAGHNIAKGLGDEGARAWQAWRGALPAAGLTMPLRRVLTDNRLHAWEWLWDGRTLRKTDAVDHAVAHDLVGSQPLEWDVAGATVEFGLDAGERHWLMGRLRAAGVAVQSSLLALYLPLYAAFQLGAFTMALQAAPDAEKATLAREVRRYGQWVRRVLG
ncbi:MAG: hypothetical protein KBC94_05540 [Pseudacidovorax sp.]|uniref:hypothetical protein n=1 Tax=Pseudacidovorax sp. TaxID=1934311 RepID=UPI001B50500B|nr:hypothetical protein [Pseudacidovorax sp.]MBP6893865.1 hypothetical protein [Pseudacidovorax sp.]